jgi:ubiquitin-protein ligase
LSVTCPPFSDGKYEGRPCWIEEAQQVAVYRWHVSFTAEALPAHFCGVAFTVEIQYDPDYPSHRPLARMVFPAQPFHPYVGEDGVIFWHAADVKLATAPLPQPSELIYVVEAVRLTLAHPVKRSVAYVVNNDAASLIFSDSKSDREVYQTLWHDSIGFISE